MSCPRRKVHVLSGRRRLSAPIATASIATAILIGGTALGLAQAEQEEEQADVTATIQTEQPVPTPSTQRPSPPVARNLERAASPTPSPTNLKVISTGKCAASFYWEPQPTANGERFNPEALTAAHKTLPFNSRVRVTNPNNGKSVVVRINDRGPYIDGRCLDLSRAAFRTIANLETGVLKVVNYEVLGK